MYVMLDNVAEVEKGLWSLDHFVGHIALNSGEIYLFVVIMIIINDDQKVIPSLELLNHCQCIKPLWKAL